MSQTGPVTQIATPKPKWADLGVRTLSASVLMPGVILDVWLGGVWFELFVAILGVLIALEYVAIVHKGNNMQFALHAAAAMAAAILPNGTGPTPALVAVLILAVLSAVGTKMTSSASSVWNYWGVIYVSVPVLALVTIRNAEPNGVMALFYILVLVWSADIFAYFFGKSIGGPKLIPSISPNKTWSGLVGAMFGAVVTAIIFDLYGNLGSLWKLALFSAVLAVFEQVGDIIESALKTQVWRQGLR